MTRLVLLAGVAATAVPLLALLPVDAPRAPRAPTVLLPSPVPAPPARRLFAAAPETALVLPPAGQAAADPALPQLVGVIGRLPDDAVALVRGDGARARSLAIGDVERGWRLEALSANAALFTRDGIRRRVEISAGAPSP